MSRAKTFLSTLWKRLPPNWRWRLLWLLSDQFVVGVTGVVLNARDELLLAHHVYRDKIVWGLPGGGVKHDESLESAIHREILEETGLSIQVDYLLQVNLDLRRPLLNCYFLCTAEGTPHPQPNGELFEVGFYPLDALPGTVDPDQWAIVQRGLQVRERPELSMTIPTGVDPSDSY